MKIEEKKRKNVDDKMEKWSFFLPLLRFYFSFFLSFHERMLEYQVWFI